MQRGGIIVGTAVGALVAAALFVAPAFGAGERPARGVRHINVAARSIGAFTPASADPRLAAMLSRGGLDPSGFRFTPAETRTTNRAVTVAVRARTNSTANTPGVAVAAQPSVGVAPIAYSLGAAVGWKRFAISGDIDHVDLGILPGSRESADVALSYAGRRFTGRVQAASDRPLPSTPILLDSVQNYSVDVGGSYALTHNLDVTAGLRYQTDRERLTHLDDNRRDSQAVYVGTAFRF